MTKASDNVFPKVIGAEGAAPSTPAAATSILYVKADGLWYSKDDAGTETLVSGGAGGGGYTAVPWSVGTAMPGAPSTNDRVTRTDLGMDFYYDGTRWLSVTEYTLPFGIGDNAIGGLSLPLSANSRFWGPVRGGGYAMWITSFQVGYYVATTNDGTKYWTFAIKDDAGSTVATTNTAAGAADTWTQVSVAVGAVLAAARSSLNLAANKTSTPGTAYVAGMVVYRIIGT